MLNLLSANVRRLWINKAFWFTVIFMASVEGLLCLLLSAQGPLPSDFVLFLSFQGIGIVTSIFFSLFLGTEYSDGTIRNKLIVGHKRSCIYLASLITGIVAITILYLTGILMGGIIGVCFFASPHFPIAQIVLAAGIGWLACISYIAIFTFIGMLSSSKAKTSILCILIAFGFVFAGLLCYSLAMQGVLPDFNQFLLDINPFGQTAQTISIDINEPWRLSFYSLVLSITLTGLGIFVFNKKDLK